MAAIPGGIVKVSIIVNALIIGFAVTVFALGNVKAESFDTWLHNREMEDKADENNRLLQDQLDALQEQQDSLDDINRKLDDLESNE